MFSMHRHQQAINIGRNKETENKGYSKVQVAVFFFSPFWQNDSAALKLWNLHNNKIMLIYQIKSTKQEYSHNIWVLKFPWKT